MTADFGVYDTITFRTNYYSGFRQFILANGLKSASGNGVRVRVPPAASPSIVGKALIVRGFVALLVRVGEGNSAEPKGVKG